MGDWIHVHHCVICADHATAVRIYERLEVAAERIDDDSGGPSGLRWGFCSPRVVLVTTTSKWGTYPGFIGPIVEGLAEVDCITSPATDEEEGPSFEALLRARFGAGRAFLWCDKSSVMTELLAALEPWRTALTTVALLDQPGQPIELPPAAATALALLRYTSVVHGFIGLGGEYFVVGTVDDDGVRGESPLWTPLAAAREAGPGAWAIHQRLDGNDLLPLHAASAADLWRIERHGAHGLWQPREQRLARARTALTSAVSEERQAGCALARRWHLVELVDEISGRTGDPDAHVRAAAELALTAFAPARASGAGDLEPLLDELESSCSDEQLRLLRRLAGTELSDDQALRVAACVEELAEFTDADELLPLVSIVARIERGLAARIVAFAEHPAPHQLAQFREIIVAEAPRWLEADVHDTSRALHRHGRELGDCRSLIEPLLKHLDAKPEGAVIDALGSIGGHDERVRTALRQLATGSNRWPAYHARAALLGSDDTWAWAQLEVALTDAERAGVWFDALVADERGLMSERGLAAAERASTVAALRNRLLSAIFRAPVDARCTKLLEALTAAEVSSTAPAATSLERRKGIAEVLTRFGSIPLLRTVAAEHPADGARRLAWLGLAALGSAEDVARATAWIEDGVVGATARWMVATRGDLDRALMVQVIGSCAELGELHRCFDVDLEPTRARAFAARIAELAYAATRTAYWMVRYSTPGRDGPPRLEALRDRDEWDGDYRSAAARISCWAARSIEAAGDPDARRAALRAFVAFDELLAACRANRVFWLPPIGIIHAWLEDVLMGRPFDAEGDRLFGPTEQASLEAAHARLRESSELVQEGIDALQPTPAPLSIWCYTQYGRDAFQRISWIANAVASQLLARGEPERALPYAETAVQSASWDHDAPRDTKIRLLLALGRAEEGYELARAMLARRPDHEALADIASSDGYQAWLRSRGAPRSGGALTVA